MRENRIDGDGSLRNRFKIDASKRNYRSKRFTTARDDETDPRRKHSTRASTTCGWRCSSQLW